MPDDPMIEQRPGSRRAAPVPTKRYRALRTLVCRDERFKPGDELPEWVLEASPSLITKRLGQDIEEVI